MQKNQLEEIYRNLNIEPEFSGKFKDWLSRKANSLHKRDKKKAENQRISFHYTKADYEKAIVKAINGQDPLLDKYTGEKLDWTKIGQYNNDESRKTGKEYKAEFAMMPTVDHISAKPEPDFVICSWRTNDAKNDLTENEFEKLCITYLTHRGYVISSK